MAKGLRKDPSQPDIDLVELHELHKVSSRLTSKQSLHFLRVFVHSDHPFAAPRHIFLATIPDATEASWAQGFWAPPGRLLELYQKQVPWTAVAMCAMFGVYFCATFSKAKSNT